MLCYEISKAPTERLFRRKMNELKSTKPAAVEALEKYPHRLWADYADRGNITWNQSATNFSDSTNNMLEAQVCRPGRPPQRFVQWSTVSRMARPLSHGLGGSTGEASDKWFSR